MTRVDIIGAANADRLPLIDHLVWGGPDLEAEIERLERWTGVRATLGGRHPGEGTRNALIRAGRAVYLELIAPDFTQPQPPRPRWFGLDALPRPRLITWAAKSGDLDGNRAAAQAAGIPLGEVRSGRRELGNGQALSWRLTYPDMLVGDGLVPFLIDWGDGPHPAQTAPEGLELVGLHAEHPAPTVMTQLLGRLGLALRVILGPTPALIATLDTPRGRVELR
jgi:hypothetical protein